MRHLPELGDHRLDGLTVVIPSAGRAATCGATVRLFPDPLLCVAESEAELYRRACPGTRLLTHPDDLPGMVKKRQFILDRVDSEAVLMVDDDVDALLCLVGQRTRRLTDPDTVLQVVEQTARLAKGLGTCLFGYAHTANPKHYHAFAPLRFTGYVNGLACGFVGRDPAVRFDARLTTHADIDISLQALLVRRIVLLDERFAFRTTKFFTRTGGMARIRTTEVMRADVAYLKRKWGDAVEIRRWERPKAGGRRSVSLHVVR